MLLAHTGQLMYVREDRAAASMLENGELEHFVKERYSKWNGKNAKMLSGDLDLENIYRKVLNERIEPNQNQGNRNISKI